MSALGSVHKVTLGLSLGLLSMATCPVTRINLVQVEHAPGDILSSLNKIFSPMSKKHSNQFVLPGMGDFTRNVCKLHLKAAGETK